MRIIRKSWMKYSMKAAVANYVKKTQFGINKHFCV